LRTFFPLCLVVGENLGCYYFCLSWALLQRRMGNSGFCAVVCNFFGVKALFL
jgi:hypothetical protein